MHMNSPQNATELWHFSSVQFRRVLHALTAAWSNKSPNCHHCSALKATNTSVNQLVSQSDAAVAAAVWARNAADCSGAFDATRRAARLKTRHALKSRITASVNGRLMVPVNLAFLACVILSVFHPKRQRTTDGVVSTRPDYGFTARAK